MSETDSAYCRLCAKSKPYGKLVNLETDGNRRQNIVAKLLRLSVEVANLNSPHDALPKTVCFPCIESLDKAFEFVLNVEASQNELDALSLLNVKQEEISDDGSSSDEEISEEVTVKLEFEINEEVSHNSEANTNEVRHDSESNSIKETSKEDNVNKKEQTDKNCLKKTSLTDPYASWKDYSWLCAYCDLMFPSIDELKHHSMESHGCCNPYRCPDCKGRKLRLDKYLKHVNLHSNNLKLSCYKCHKIFDRYYDAIMHKKEHFVTPFRCTGCNANFATQELCVNHCSTYNKDKTIREVPPEHLTKDLTCVFCHKQFNSKGSLVTHLLGQHGEKKRIHTCEQCGKCFANKPNLDNHLLTHSEARPYKCEICKHCFRQQSHLTTHMGTHDEKKPFACDKCEKRFRLKKQLKDHSIAHRDEFPFVCSYCKKGFKYRSNIVQHERLHTGERPYKCHHCPREFSNWPNYNKHMKRRHGLNMIKRNLPPEGSLKDSNKLDGELADLPKQSKTFVPKKRGRPKIVKSFKKINPSNENRTEVTLSES